VNREEVGILAVFPSMNPTISNPSRGVNPPRVARGRRVLRPTYPVFPDLKGMVS
jgi:hypothetical protein